MDDNIYIIINKYILDIYIYLIHRTLSATLGFTESLEIVRAFELFLHILSVTECVVDIFFTVRDIIQFQRWG